MDAPFSLDAIADHHATGWAFRLLLGREPLPDDPLPDRLTTLRALRATLLAMDGDTAAPSPVTRDAVIWAFRILLGRDPEAESVISAFAALPDRATLVASIRASDEFRAALSAPAERSVALRIAGQDAVLTGYASDDYMSGVADLSKELARLVSIATAARRARTGAFEMLDIGANLGVTSLALARSFPGQRVVAIEAGPDIVALLRRNLAANGAGEVEVIHAAIGREEGLAAFHQASFMAGSHLLLGEGPSPATHQVRLRTLDAICGECGLHHLGFIKLDIEGAERDALEGGFASLARMRPVILAEFNPWTILGMANQNPREVLEWMLDRIPFVHVRSADGRWERLHSAGRLLFLHEVMVRRHCQDDLVLSWDDAWLEGVA